MTGTDQEIDPTLEKTKQIHCDFCGLINTPDSGYCSSCGQALVTNQESALDELDSDCGDGETIMVIKRRSGPRRFRLVLLTSDNDDRHCFDIKDGSLIGRTHGDIQLRNGHVSRRHCSFEIRNDRLYLTDLNSTNGVYLRVRGNTRIDPPAELLMGKSLFRIVPRA